MRIHTDDIELTRLEYEIIDFLSTNLGMVFEKDRIYGRICGFDAEGDSREDDILLLPVWIPAGRQYSFAFDRAFA